MLVMELKAKAAPGILGVETVTQKPPAERGQDENLAAPYKGERAGKPARHAHF